MGNLLGTRMTLNELVAFSQLGPLKDVITDRSYIIATFALCGFAISVPSGYRSEDRGARAEAAESCAPRIEHARRHHGELMSLDREHADLKGVRMKDTSE